MRIRRVVVNPAPHRRRVGEFMLAWSCRTCSDQHGVTGMSARLLERAPRKRVLMQELAYGMDDAVLPGESAPCGAQERVARRLAGMVDERMASSQRPCAKCSAASSRLRSAATLTASLSPLAKPRAMGERALGQISAMARPARCRRSEAGAAAANSCVDHPIDPNVFRESKANNRARFSKARRIISPARFRASPRASIRLNSPGQPRWRRAANPQPSDRKTNCPSSNLTIGSRVQARRQSRVVTSTRAAASELAASSSRSAASKAGPGPPRRNAARRRPEAAGVGEGSASARGKAV